MSDPILNLTDDGKVLTFRSAMRSKDAHLWTESNGEELARLIDTKTLCPIHRKDQPIEQRHLTTYYNPQVKEKLDSAGNKVRRVRGTFGGNKKCSYDGPTSSPVADIVVIKLHWQSVISDRRNHKTDTRYATIDIKDFYLGSSLPQSEWISIPVANIPEETLARYSLHQFIVKGHVLFRVDGTMYGHPVAGRLANQDLVDHLATAGYVQDPNIPCLFSHTTSSISFTLVVDDFGVKYSNVTDYEALVSHLEKKYRISEDRTGSKYIGIRLQWDYSTNTLVTDMPNYVATSLARLCPDGPPRPSKTPGIYLPPKYGAPNLGPTVDTSPLVSAADKQFIMEVVGTFLFYARMVDHTMLPAVTFISKKQSAPTEQTLAATHMLLRYAVSHPNHCVTFKACDMVLKVISDGSHLSQENAGSIAGGYHYCGNHSDAPTILNGAILPVCSSIPTVCGAASETEYAALYMNGQHAYFERVVLESLGYPQAATKLYADNKAAVGIATDSVKLRKSKAIDMRYHWIRDRVRQKVFDVIWAEGKGNDADFFTKLQPSARHQYFIKRFVV
jgi:hypothetical protein